jgi:hypothetical protein
MEAGPFRKSSLRNQHYNGSNIASEQHSAAFLHGLAPFQPFARTTGSGPVGWKGDLRTRFQRELLRLPPLASTPRRKISNSAQRRHLDGRPLTREPARN